MSSQQPPEKDPTEDLPPGADRFWGQFSQARAGRSSGTAEKLGSADAGQHATDHECLEWCPICRSAELLRATASPEIRQQLQTIQNEAFQIFRAFAAAYAERTGHDPFDGPAGSTESSSTNGRPARSPGEGPAGPGDPGPDEPEIKDISIE